MMNLKKNISSGFTLIEMMAALVIFGVIGLTTSIALRNTINTYQYIEETSQELNELQIGFTFLSQDFSQFIPQVVTTPDDKELALIALTPSIRLDIPPNNIKAYIEFTSNGFAESREKTHRQSVLRRVAYVFNGSELVRYYWPITRSDDRAPNIVKEVIFNDVDDLQFGFYDKNNNIVRSQDRNWKNNPELIFKIIEVSINFSDGESVRRLFAMDIQ